MNNGFKTQICLRPHGKILFVVKYTKSLFDIWWTASIHDTVEEAIQAEQGLKEIALKYKVE